MAEDDEGPDCPGACHKAWMIRVLKNPGAGPLAGGPGLVFKPRAPASLAVGPRAERSAHSGPVSGLDPKAAPAPFGSAGPGPAPSRLPDPKAWGGG